MFSLGDWTYQCLSYVLPLYKEFLIGFKKSNIYFYIQIEKWEGVLVVFLIKLSLHFANLNFARFGNLDIRFNIM